MLLMYLFCNDHKILTSTAKTSFSVSPGHHVEQEDPLHVPDKASKTSALGSSESI